MNLELGLITIHSCWFLYFLAFPLSTSYKVYETKALIRWGAIP